MTFFIFFCVLRQTAPTLGVRSSGNPQQSGLWAVPLSFGAAPRPCVRKESAASEPPESAKELAPWAVWV